MVTLTTPTVRAASTVGQQAVAYARTQIGKPYKLGATGPGAYDCSGLVIASYRAAGVDLSKTRTSAQLATIGTGVKMSELQAGDILYFPGHVALYAGNGNIIESASVRTGGVREVKKYSTFVTARRVTADSTGSTIPVIGGVVDAVNGAVSGVLDGAGDALSVLNPFTDWQNNLMGVLIRATFAVAGVGLVVLGVSRVVAQKLQPVTDPILEKLGASTS